MNCQNIDGQLSDYVELSLGAPSLALVEEHLVICASCREQAALLGETIGAVASLPLADPPLGFTQRVMSHVRESETQVNRWQRFFLSLSGKIPAQATAVVMLAVLGIYLVQKEQSAEQAPATTTAARTNTANTPLPIDGPETPERSASAQFANSAGQESAPISSSGQRRRQSSSQEQSASRIVNSATPPAPSAPAAALPDIQAKETTIRATPVVSGSSVVTAPLQSNSGAAGFSSQPDADSTAFRSSPATIELFADFELILRRHLAPAEAHGDPAAGTLRKAEASSPNPRPIDGLIAAIPDRSRPQTIWINVPESQYEDFKRELHALGAIESEIRVPLLREQANEYSDGQIRVKLTALPSNETSTPANGR